MNILWADDEIELLKPHILFLEGKGFKVHTVNNGSDAFEISKNENFDIIFLDENMPGLSGLETLERIKEIRPHTPVVMITKSEEEAIMEEAIGGKIADYLIKPVNPNQILLSIKKNLDSKRLVSEKTNLNYQQEFRQIGMQLQSRMDLDEWKELFKKITYWELQLEKSNDKNMHEILTMQKTEANQLFSRYVKDNYLEWLNGSSSDSPVLSHTLIKNYFQPILKSKKPVFLVVIDNLRYDQWLVIQPHLSEHFKIAKEELFFSILPTATQYARNALFAGLMPSEIQKKFPTLWKNDEDEGGKNMHEQEFFEAQMKRLGESSKLSYNKITNLNAGKKLVENFNQLLNNDVNVIVYNFVDMLSHARTDMEVIRELADDDAAYRSLTKSWFEHSPLLELLEKMAQHGCDVALTTDHGTIKVSEPSKVVGDKNTTTNLRYKQGKNLSYEAKEVFAITKPEEAFLPKQNLSSSYIFAMEDKFFAYPNNFNHYVTYYRNTFQHGGISMEEMIIPFVHLQPK
jgi:DNA-binding response OmpR family regulator